MMQQFDYVVMIYKSWENWDDGKITEPHTDILK